MKRSRLPAHFVGKKIQRLPVEKRVQLYHGEISEADFKKIAKEASTCPVCAGRPLLHMRLCMIKPPKLKRS